MTNYVAGFFFSEDLMKVALIRKNKPEWQRGLLNGVGGKIEAGESPLDAMQREFFEEAGVMTLRDHWTKVLEMQDNATFSVHFFAAIGDVSTVRSIEDEKIEVIDVESITIHRPDVVENIPWLVGMAVDMMKDGRPFGAIVNYPPPC